MPHGPFEREIAGVSIARAADINAIYAALEDTPTVEEANASYAAKAATEAAIARVDPVSAGSLGTVLAWNEDDEPDHDAISVSPLMFGATGNGSTDDTTALGKWRDFAVANPGGLSDGRGLVLDGRDKIYVVSSTVEFRDIWHLKLRNVRLRVSGTLTDVLLFNGVSFSDIEDVTIVGAGGYEGGATADYAVRWESRQAAGGQVSTQNTLRNVRVIDLKAKAGIALGPTSGAYQVDQFRLYGCAVQGNWSVGSPDATYYQEGIVCGSGTSGNILLHHFFGCQSSGYRYNLHADATDVYWYGGIMQNAEANVLHTAAATLLVSGVRSESSQRFFLSENVGAVMPAIRLADITYQCDQLHSDGYWVNHLTLGTVVVENCNVNQAGSAYTPKIRMGYSAAPGATLIVLGLRAPTTLATCYTRGSVTTGGFIIGYTEVNPSTGAVVAVSPGITMIGYAPVKTGVSTTAARPTASTLGEAGMIYDTNLDIPLWSDGSNWYNALRANVLARSSNYTATGTSDVLTVDATSAAVTITLPAVANLGGKRITVKKTDASANGVVIDGNGAETIDGAATKTITSQYGFVTVVCDGTAWHIVASAGTIS